MNTIYQKFIKLTIYLIFLMGTFPLLPAYAQPSPTLSATLSVTATRNENNCATPGITCETHIIAYMDWSKSSAFPYEEPSSPTGYWSGFVFMFSNTSPQTIIGSSAYTGHTHVVTFEGQTTVEGMESFIHDLYADNIRVRTTFVNAQGVATVVESASPTPLVQDIGDLAWADEPFSADKTLLNKHNLSCSGDPVYLHSGQFSYQCNDLNIPGRKLDVEMNHSYLSGLTFNGPFGYGWTLNYYMRLHQLRNGNVIIVSGGQKNEYTFLGGTYIPPLGHFEALVKNVNNSWTLTLAQGEKYEFDSHGKLIAIVDRNNNSLTLTYDSQKQPIFGYSEFSQNPTSQIQVGLDWRLTQITDTTGRVITLNYNIDGLLSSIVDGTRSINYAYDSVTNDLLSVTKSVTQYPSGLTKSFEYENHNVKKIKDPKQQYFVENFYDTQVRVFKQNLGGHDMLFDYSVPGETIETDRKGFVKKFTFNPNGNVTKKEEFTAGLHVGDPSVFVTEYTYNNDSLLTSVKNPKLNGTTYIFDSANPNSTARGNLLQVRRKTDIAAADNNTNDIVANFTYESQFNQIKTMTDPKGNVTTYTYDYELPTNHPKYNTRGNLIFIDYPAVTAGIPTMEFAYNIDGQVTETKDPNGNITNYTYSPTTGHLQSVVRDPAGINALTQFTYDNFGYLDTVTDANNHVTDMDFSELGWLIQEKNPRNFLTKYTYDENGNVKKIERQANAGASVWQTTNMTYTLLNHVYEIFDPLNRKTEHLYDENENLKQTKDAENNITQYDYDERSKLFKVTDANTPQGITQYDYDINGNLKTIIDANSHATDYAFDLFDRQFTQTLADGKIYKSEYDKNSNLEKLTKPSTSPAVTIQYGYDELNRLINKHYPLTTNLDSTYAYDLGSRLIDANTAAAQNHFTYDNLNRVDINRQTLNSISYSTNTDYDKAGNRTKVTYPSGKVIDYTYDADDNMDLVKVGGATITDYDYDTLDRRLSKSYVLNPASLVTRYQFDIANQLSQIQNGSISRYDYPSYDAVGNRKIMNRILNNQRRETTSYTYNNIYELTQATSSLGANHSYSYDNVANRQIADGVAYNSNSVNQYSSVGGTTYLYDNNGNLTNDGNATYTYDEENRLTTYNLPLNTGGYAYDAFNRRVSKIVNGTTTYFVQDGDREIEERNINGRFLADYVYGDGIDEVLVMERGAGPKYYHYDGLGSVTEITDAAGTVVENYTYDPYGTPSVINSMIGNPSRFTGRRFDEETGLYHYRARVYDPTIGRFLQRDPVGYVDGMNVYTYTHNNPINYTDPFGNIAIADDVLFWSIVGGTAIYFAWQAGVNQPGGNPLPTLADLGIHYGWNPFNPFKNGKPPKVPKWAPFVAVVKLFNDLVNSLKPEVKNPLTNEPFPNQPLNMDDSAYPYCGTGQPTPLSPFADRV